MTDREAFEAWAKELRERHATMPDPWSAWQAATLADRERCAKECLERRGHFASDFAAQAFADILSGTARAPFMGSIPAEESDEEFARQVEAMDSKTAPTVPLTDDEIGELWVDILSNTPPSGVTDDGLVMFRFARAVLAAAQAK